MTIRDNRDYIGVLLYSFYTTITGWGGPPKIYVMVVVALLELRVCKTVAPERRIWKKVGLSVTRQGGGGKCKQRLQSVPPFRVESTQFGPKPHEHMFRPFS